MNLVKLATSAPQEVAAGLAEKLHRCLEGEARFDALTRTLYSTDASIYEIIPIGVVYPKSAADVIATVQACRESGVAVIARGAGTGLAGGAVGSGIQIDFSRFMNRVGPLDLEAQTIEVEPGVVLDELNAHLAPHGLHFAPDVATSSRATVGGMMNNNSAGAHSIIYGRTVDHVAGMTTILSDGRLARFGQAPKTFAPGENDTDRCKVIESELGRIRDSNADEIEKRYPKVLRSNGGYGLDRLGPAGSEVDPIKILCGSEGTLAITVAATLKLIPLPKHTGLVVLEYGHMLDALSATPAILKHEPAAVELMDRIILGARKAIPTLASRCGFIQGEPEAILVVEFIGHDAGEVATRVEQLVRDASALAASTSATRILDDDQQKDVWFLRKSGLGLMMSRPGEAQPYAFIEDAAVDPSKLAEYMGKVAKLAEQEGVKDVGYYAHASVGCIHVRPVLNLRQAGEVERMRRIAEGVSDLCLEYGGAMTGEHGDGLVRSCWIEKMYGPRITAALKEVKTLFDPDGLLNPGKIVDPLPMTENLRYGESFQAIPVKTHFDYGPHHDMAGMISMCSGVGQCRQRLVGTMCPSYQATGDEKHTTRARANALRVALSNRGLLNGLDDPHLAEVMDLCLSCKACKTECPTGVDMAKLKSEYLCRRNLQHGVPARSRLIASLPRFAAHAARFPRLSNFLSQSSLVRGMMERRYGLDRRVAPPPFAARTFRHWYRKHRKTRVGLSAPRGRIVYFVDTWTNYFSPSVGVAAVKLLEAAGFEVLCPRTACCGRPAIGEGMLAEAKQMAETNIRRLARLARENVPIVGTEPSCISTLIDEYPQFFPYNAAQRIAKNAQMIETFLRRLVEKEPDALPLDGRERSLLYHAHCHQKALIGSEDGVALLQHAFGSGAREINSGCCGMAGSFGHEVEHFEIAQAIGEHRLFPAIRERGDADIVVSGFSCRRQIEHHTQISPLHVVEYLAQALT